MKLTPDQILFIDNYLCNSGIYYADVRQEMIDHVASAIEAQLNQNDSLDFYSCFKNYMVQNKKELLDSLRQYKKQVTWSIFKRFFKHLFGKTGFYTNLTVFLFLVLAYNILKQYEVDGWFRYVSLVFFILTIIAYYYKLNRFRRCIGVERLGILLAFFYNIQNITNQIFGTLGESNKNVTGFIFFITLLNCTSSIIIIKMFFEMQKEYKLKKL